MRGGGGDFAQRRRRGHEIRQERAVHRHGLPFPVAARRPGQLFVIEGQVAHLGADRIDKAPGQAVGQVARQHQVLVGLFPEVRLPGPQPVDLRFGLKIGDRFVHTHQLQDHAPQPADRLQTVRAALIEPDDGGPQRFTLPIYVDHRAALGRHRDPRKGGLIHGALLPEFLAGPAQRLPVVSHVLLGPARLPGEVGIDHDLRLGDQLAVQVEHERADALRAVVNRQNQILRHRVCSRARRSRISS